MLFLSLSGNDQYTAFWQDQLVFSVLAKKYSQPEEIKLMQPLNLRTGRL